MSLVHLNKKINSWAFKYLLIQERRLINMRRGWYMYVYKAGKMSREWWRIKKTKNHRFCRKNRITQSEYCWIINSDRRENDFSIEMIVKRIHFLHFTFSSSEKKIVIGNFKCFTFSLFLVSCHQRNENVFRRGDCPNLIKLPFNAQNFSQI